MAQFGSNGYRNKVRKTKEALTAIVSAIDVCGRRNIALRGLNPDDIVGQGYDGTGSVAGKIRGVLARVKQ